MAEACSTYEEKWNVEKPEVKKPLPRPTRKWVKNISMDV
jgi:hypothetical protein